MERQFNACQTPHSMYLSIFNSFRVIRCLSQCVSPKIAIFTKFFVSPVVWMERERDAYKLSRCMCQSIYYHFWDTARYLWKNRNLSYPLAFDAPVRGGFRRNIGTPFGKEKLEWCRYPMVKKFRRYLYLFWRDPRTWRTDRRTDTAWQQRPRLHRIAR